MYTHSKSTHTLGNGDTTQQPAQDSEGELAAAAAAPPPPPPPLVLVLLLLHDPRCIAERNPSQQTVSRFAFFGRHAGASIGTAAAAVVATAAAAAAEQQQQVQQQGGPKHITSILLDIRRDDVSTKFSYGLSSPSGGPRCCCDSCAKKGLPCYRRLRRLRRHHRRRCCFCCAAAAAVLLLLSHTGTSPPCS